MADFPGEELITPSLFNLEMADPDPHVGLDAPPVDLEFADPDPHAGTGTFEIQLEFAEAGGFVSGGGAGIQVHRLAKLNTGLD